MCYQVVEQVGLVVTHSPVSSIPIILGMNILKDLDLPRLLASLSIQAGRHRAVYCELSSST